MSNGNKGRRRAKASEIQYFKRSKVFHSKIKEAGLDAIIQRIEGFRNGLRWNKKTLGISGKAFQQIARHEIEPQLIFAHPKLIQQNSMNILYYRGIAGMSQKGMKGLACDTTKLEQKEKTVSDDKAALICKALNRVISTIIEGDNSYSLSDAHRTLIGTIAISFDGSWRNTIGKNAEKAVKVIIWDYINSKELAINSAGELQTALSRAKEILLKNRSRIITGSDPDIVAYDKDGKLIVAIEIKGGLDPAGALERYGAVRKSFEKSKKANPRCHTIYLVSCITDGLEDRVKDDRLLSDMRNLIDIIYDKKEKERFLKELFTYQIRI